jgi:hypothetical protein
MYSIESMNWESYESLKYILDTSGMLFRKSLNIDAVLTLRIHPSVDTFLLNILFQQLL